MFPPGSGVAQPAHGMAPGGIPQVTQALVQGMVPGITQAGYVMPQGITPTLPINSSLTAEQMQGNSWMMSNPQAGINNKMWHGQPQPNQHIQLQQPQQSHQQQQQNDVKHRDYLKQQQRLKAMAFSSSKGVSADALIGNLLEKKDMFRPKQHMQGLQQGVQVQGGISGTGISGMGVLGIGMSSGRMPGTGVSGSSMSSSGLPGSLVSVAGAPGTGIPGTVGHMQHSDELPGWLVPGSSRLPSIYTHIWSLVCDASPGGTHVDTNKILALLLTSNLPKEVLGFIWNLATKGTNGQLTQQQLYICLALVALAQTGCTFNNLSVLNLMPQPPIPSFNMAAQKPPTEERARRSDLNLKPSQPPISSAALPSVALTPTPLPSPTLTPSPISPSITSSVYPPGPVLSQSLVENDDFGDEFTDFQSAEIIDSPSLSAIPTSLPSTAVVQPTVTAKQVVSELNHTVASKFGRSQGRSIGSRLANHTLGAPKPRSHHHRHRRSSTDHDNSYMDDEVTFGSEKSQGYSENISWKSEETQRHHFQQQDHPENEDFSDFQIAAGLNVNVDELFPRCNPKPKKRSMVLKESAIRNDSEEDGQGQPEPEIELLSLDSPPAATLNNSSPSVPAIPTSVPPVIPPPNKSTNVIMATEEDKYSALRFIELENQSGKMEASTVKVKTTEESQDEFGDFISADDSFAEIASRDTTSFSLQATPVLDVGWQAQSNQSNQFLVDDWDSSDFETPAPPSGQPNQPKNVSLDSLSSVFSGLGIASSNTPIISTSSLPILSGGNTDTVSTFNNIIATNISSSNATILNFVDNAEVVSKVGNTIPSWHFDIGIGKETSELDLKSSVTDDDDEFGDFVGPEATWSDDTAGKSAPVLLPDAAWMDESSGKPAAGLFSDNQSVSSLELPGMTLSRHGSLPSLDLKLFSNNEDNMDKFPDNVQVGDWIRCLDSCLSLLQSAVITFTNISTQEVVMEVLGTVEGHSYFSNLLEVHQTSRRIQKSFQLSGQESNYMDSLLASIQKSWNSLQIFYKLANIGMVSDKDGCGEENGQPVCGVCCCAATDGVIEYGGHTYHAPCANLWLNCVDRTLPAHSPLI